MDIAKDIEREISSLTLKLVQLSLCDEQNMPSKKISRQNGVTDISLPGNVTFTSAMKNIQYHEAYKEIEKSNSFNIKMIDGGLIQLLYRIGSKNKVESHRLAFYSSPSHETYQNEAEIYELDEIYADFIKKNIVPFPIRFDYNADSSLHVDTDHPKSHITLGQYASCRIPATSPIGPGTFVKFILRNFYNNAYKKFKELSEIKCIGFHSTITDNERKICHLNIGHVDTTFISNSK
tara:strand:- start:174 stop:878 length:705 start_codon:yes stop_codon:yes gene_type:complete